MQITTLIPAYKTAFVPELLLSLATQTYTDFNVIISDDSPDNQVTALIQSPQLQWLVSRLNIDIVQGPKMGGYSNIFNLTRQYAQNAEFFHILLDDDVIYPTFYEAHMRAHKSKIALVSVSARWSANQYGQPIKNTIDHKTSQSFAADFSAKNIAQQLVSIGTNKLGEWSHAVFRKEASAVIVNPSIENISYFGIDDLGSFIHSTMQADGIWIPDKLGIFRQHANQNTQNTQNDTIKCSHYAWIALAIASLDKGWISQQQAWACISKINGKLQLRFSQDELGSKVIQLLSQYQEYTPSIKNAFLEIWETYLSAIKIKQILEGDLTIKLL